MLRDESRPSFDTAARHLFRHLDDPRALRGNFIVQRFFAGTDANDRVVLQRIRQLVRQAAEECKQTDAAAGKDERAARHYAIAISSFLDDRPVDEVAAVLGLSRRQYYRERGDIGTRIARYIDAYDDASLAVVEPVLDEARIRIGQAELRLHAGDAEKALRIYDEIAASGGAAEVRVNAVARAVEIHLNRHDADRAIAAHADARRIASEAATPLSEAYVDHIAMDIAWYKGRISEASMFVERVLARLRPLLSTVNEPAMELYARSVGERGKYYCVHGDLRASIENVSEAERLLLRANASPFRTMDLAILAGRLRGWLAVDSAYWRPAGQRLQEMTELYDRARALGSSAITLRALLALLEHHSHAGNDEAALDTARFVIAFAERNGPELICASCEASIALSQTRNWREARAMLRSCGEHVAPHRSQFDWAKARYALRSGAYSEALSVASAPENSWSKRAMVTRMHAVAAEAAKALGKQPEAVHFVESAVSSAEEGYGSAASLRDAYLVAARVTQEERFRRKAKEVQRALTG